MIKNYKLFLISRMSTNRILANKFFGWVPWIVAGAVYLITTNWIWSFAVYVPLARMHAFPRDGAEELLTWAVAIAVYLITTNWGYSIVVYVLFGVALEELGRNKLMNQKATRARAKEEKKEKALTPAQRRLRKFREEQALKGPDKKRSMAAKKAWQTRRENEARAAKERQERGYGKYSKPSPSLSELFDTRGARKSKGLVDYAHALTSAWCPVCKGNMEGGPGGRRRWFCPRCGQLYDSNGNAVN